MSQYRKTLSIILFLIISSTQFFAQNSGDYSVINVNVDVNVYSGEIDIDPLEVNDLKVSIYGTVNIYGIYNPTLPKIPTPKRVSLSISPNPINTTLTPIIIPPVNPGSTRLQSTETGLNRVLLGRFNLGLMDPRFDFQTTDYIFRLGIGETSNKTLIDQEEIPIKVFNPQHLADLIVPHAETLKNSVSSTRDGVIIKAYIINAGRDDIIEKSTVKFYSKKERGLRLLGSTTLEPLESGEQKHTILSINGNTYQNIVNEYIYISLLMQMTIYLN